MNTTKTGLGILFVLTLVSTILLNIPYVENNITAAIYVPNPDLGDAPIVTMYCEDSDNGITTNVKGTTTTQTDSIKDYCLDSNSVREYYCDGIFRSSVDKLCADGLECVDGACKEINYYCTDTDSGINTDVKGSVRSNQGTVSDYCISSSKLREYYCEREISSYTDETAPQGFECNDGRFVEKACSGPVYTQIDIYRKNSAIGISDSYATHTDYCRSSNTVVNFYCDESNRVMSYAKECPSGYLCSDGACISKVTCDGPESINLYKKYTTKLDETSKTDYCLSESKVKKYYCENNEIVEETKNCPDKYICYNGACLLEKNVECEDDDVGRTNDGKDIYNVGIVTKGEFREYEDECLTSTKIREYICGSNNIVTYEDINCPNGYYCTRGRCVQSGANEYCYNYGEGYVITQNGKYNNYCIDGGLVREYYCSNNVMNYRDVYCPNNYVCNSGQCINTQTETEEESEDNTNPPSLDEIEEIENFKIYIKKGWNLFPVIPYEINTYQVIENDCVNFNGDIIWGYNKQKKDYESTNNLEVGKAYWFYSTKNCEFEYQVLSGSTTNKISLTEGWNMFSVTKTILVSELKDCEIVKGPYKFDTASKRYIRVKQLIKGEGYFVKLNNSCTIN